MFTLCYYAAIMLLLLFAGTVCILLLLLLSDLGYARVIIEAVLLIETMTPLPQYAHSEVNLIVGELSMREGELIPQRLFEVVVTHRGNLN